MAVEFRGFHYADYIVFAITIIISVGIGIYYALAGSKKKTTSEYLVGSRSMKIVPITLSLMVSFESSIMMLGFPAEIYTFGMMFWWGCFGFLFVMLIGARMIVPLIHPLKITSVYQYLDLRFKSRAVRAVGSTLAVLNTILYMGVVLFGPAIALQAVMGFPLVWSMTTVAAASMIYTTIGTMDVGGPSEVFRLGKEGGRLKMFNFSPDPTIRHTFWILVIGMTLRTMGLAVGQASIQRISSTPTKRDAQKVMAMVGPMFFITMTLAMLEGLVAFAYYSKIKCDPMASGQIDNANQIMPLFVLDLFANLPGMPGLFMASLFSASLSTLSSGLSALSAQTVEDYVMPFMSKKSDRVKTILARISVIIYGLLAVATSMIISTVGGNMSQIGFSLMASFVGPASGLILVAALVPFVNHIGALVGVVCGVCITFWLSTGSYLSSSLMKEPILPPAPIDNCPLTNSTLSAYNYTLQSIQKIEDFKNYTPEGIDKVYSVSYLWLGGVAVLIVFVVSSIVSFITGRIKPGETEAIYTVPVFDLFCCCFPDCILKPLRCGVDYSKKIKDDDKYDDVELELDENGGLIRPIIKINSD
ncbi:hypothetical protein LOTGIDRAFT_235457 [Lottia gigantea]|uniref:Uncharacterized protein n=1 Tax=Lottia gigantea TaxID=225164 RepID=V3ZQ12_LOTGI|nr:hypothetical protein LOTGIDRAFT_235457 [Lottia gigantea]ESO86422.1 hypothetical protein LOTGIDRAFT_235457 [Lottia gigantea]